MVVDEYSRYTWVFLLKSKSETAGELIAFITEMDRLNGNVVKQLRSDHGTEFRNRTLENFCVEKGISQNFSSVMTPEQNGVAERRNRTLIEAARTMLLESGLSKGFWTEAIRTACYTQNRTTIVNRHNKTSFELFTERKPTVKYFHIFGCQCFILNQRDHLGKFDAKADRGIFVGYSLISAAYRVYNLKRKVIEESIHVTFEDSVEGVLSDSVPDNESFDFEELSHFPPGEPSVEPDCDNSDDSSEELAYHQTSIPSTSSNPPNMS